MLPGWGRSFSSHSLLGLFFLGVLQWEHQRGEKKPLAWGNECRWSANAIWVPKHPSSGNSYQLLLTWVGFQPIALPCKGGKNWDHQCAVPIYGFLHTGPYTGLCYFCLEQFTSCYRERSRYVDAMLLCQQPDEGVWDASRSEFPRSCGAFNCVTPFRVNGTINLYINSKMCPVGSVSLTWTSVVSPVPSFTICYGDIIATQHSSQWLS